MNKTKKLTQGAMMLAIFGALILIDRMTTYLFTEFVVLVAPIIIIMYSAMQTFKDGLLLSIGVLIIAFLLGNFQTLYIIFIPVGVVTGLVYAYGVNKGLDKSTLAFLACATYVVGEVVASYVIYPVLGFPVKQMIEEFKVALNQSGSLAGVDYTSVFASAGFEIDKILVVIFLIATIFTGVMEGLLIHILSIFLLKRFKIKDLGRLNLWEIKPNKVIAYISFLSTFVFYFKDKITNENAYYIAITVAIIGAIILMYYGYLFICLYGSIVARRNIGLLFVIIAMFIPILLLALMIMGFLYATGPLRQYLENKVEQIKHE